MRADLALAARGLAPSRTRARQLIENGLVECNGAVVTRPSAQVGSGDRLTVRALDHPYVSRGALKLERALEVFRVDPRDRVCADIGASTGGFTEVLLVHGAKLVYAVDVGTNQLHPRIASDPRVVSMEQTNARMLTPDMFDPQPSIAVMDVSFISVRLILPALFGLADTCIILIKPQFEAGRACLDKHGIVRDRDAHMRVIEEICAFVSDRGWTLSDITPSPIPGGSGNREYLALLTNPCDNRRKISASTQMMRQAVFGETE